MDRYCIEHDGERLLFIDPQSTDHKFHKISTTDQKKFEDWALQYEKLHDHLEPRSGMLAIGRDMFGYLNKVSGGWLQSLCAQAEPPLYLEFVVPLHAQKETRLKTQQFLNVPWELLADETGFLAANAKIKLCPLRRLGDASDPQQPSVYRLSLLFMAAAPHGASHLDYEGEEKAILDAVQDIGLDMSVEESGTLAELANCARDLKPDVIHLSCHGNSKPDLRLSLETDVGGEHPVNPERLSAELGEQRPPLLFLSACLTSQVNRFITSYTAELIERGFPAALGWGGSVRDVDATQFASRLYHYLSAQNSMEFALAQARFEMLNPVEPEEKPAKDWHLARLYLGPHGGGKLSASHRAQRRRAQQAGYKEFLGKTEVPVASKFEFTGRRRQIQAILRTFRQNSHAGVLIHAVGRQGKSSLAARVAHRLPDLQTVVVYEYYQERDILAAILRDAPFPGVRELIAEYQRAKSGEHPDFMVLLRSLLEGPLCELERQTNNRPGARPILLIIDDFERALQAPPKGSNDPHTIKPELSDTIAAVIQAFDGAETDSRLIFTSRTTFLLRYNGRDLTERLLPISLPPLSENERAKQYENNLALATAPAWLKDENIRYRCIAVARGNPGLQKLLFNLCSVSKQKSQDVLSEMEAYLASGEAPTAEAELVQFLQNLALDSLVELLTDGETQIVRATTLFHLPVPDSVCHGLAGQLVDDAATSTKRLLGFGVWEQFEDLVDPMKRALGVNGMIQPKLAPLTDAEIVDLAKRTIEPLFHAWGGPDGGKRRMGIVDYELTRLALLAENSRVLKHAALGAVNWLNGLERPQQAAEVGINAIARIEASQLIPEISLYSQTAEICQQIGDVKHAEQFLLTSLDLIQNKPKLSISEFDKAATYGRYARLLIDRGEPQQAEGYFEQAGTEFKRGGFGREMAIILGDIARIKVSRGEVDAALELHQQELQVYEALGDRRSAAVTLGDIARINVSRGEVDAALELHQQRLSVFEALGDRRELAITLGDIARIKVSRGEVDAALELHQQMLDVFEALGDRRSAAVTLGDIARIKVSRGEVDAALELHQQELQVYEALGDIDSKAATLWKMAQIDLQRGDGQAAFEKLTQSYQINMELGRLDGICMVGLDLGQLLAVAGQKDQAIQILQRSRQGFEQLGWRQYAEQARHLLDEIKA